MILLTYEVELQPLLLTAVTHIICMTMAIICFRNTPSISVTS